MKNSSSKKLPSLSSSPTNTYKRGLTYSKSKLSSKAKINSKILKKTIEKEETLICLFCKKALISKEVFRHLEFDCELFFTKKMNTKLNYSNNDKLSIIKCNINSKFTPFTETPDPVYYQYEVLSQQTLNLSVHSKEYKPNKNLVLLKEISVSDLDIGQINFKSHMFCVFNLSQKGKSTINYLAYKIENNNVEILCLIDDSVAAILTEHKDTITEIKYLKSKSDIGYLTTCSYDGFVIIWNIDSFSINKKINFSNWVLSCTLATYDNNDFLYVAGGYLKNYPIKAYDLNTGVYKYSIELKVDSIPSILEKYQEKSKLLICGTDYDNPQIIFINYYEMKIVKLFELNSCITSISIYSNSHAQVILYTTDYNGYVREYDIIKMKQVLEVKCGEICLDATLWDDYNILTCGDGTSIKSIIRHKQKIAKVYRNLHDKIILNIQKYYVIGMGNVLFTLSADKKIKLFKL